jgi:hypothetical protein
LFVSRSNAEAEYGSREAVMKREGVILGILATALVFCLCLAPARAAHPQDAEVIKDLQAQLKEFGYDPGTIDGKWGTKTELALKKFQRDNKLAATGKLDEDTKRMIESKQTLTITGTLLNEDKTPVVDKTVLIVTLSVTELDNPPPPPGVVLPPGVVPVHSTTTSFTAYYDSQSNILNPHGNLDASGHFSITIDAQNRRHVAEGSPVLAIQVGKEFRTLKMSSGDLLSIRLGQRGSIDLGELIVKYDQ